MRTRNGILNGPCSAEDNINHIRMVSLFLHLGALRNSENFLLSRSPSGNSDGLIRVDFISTKIRSEARGVFSLCILRSKHNHDLMHVFSRQADRESRYANKKVDTNRK
jgi:hypothetical protein